MIFNKNKETTLLDSSLISKYNKIELSDKMYQIKVFDCGKYVHFYIYEFNKFKKDNSFIDLKNIDTDNLVKKGSKELKSISLSNAIRSNLSVQRLARCNIDSWNSFITLTFAENITDISFANKKFNQFISNVRKLKKDFKYLAVPEFQKRGAVHYHMLSNISENDNVIMLQKDKKGRALKIDSLYDVKYWSFGFCRVDFIKSNHQKIFSYLCKYMTKDIDDRLFMKKRYLYSHNLIKPKEYYIDYSNLKDKLFFDSLCFDKSVVYNNEYFDIYNKTNIKFFELKKD